MADSETVEQQVTSKTPATKQKNPKRVAAGKAIAQKTKQAREAQKKALAEAQVIIANNQLKPAPDPPTVADTPSADPPPSTKNVLTTTQWLCNQHYRFISGHILQTRRDQKRFYQKSRLTIATSTPTS